MSDILLRQMSYYKTGGTASQLVAPSQQNDLIAAFKEICANNIKYFFLGAGSNSLISDEPYLGAVISLQNLCSIYPIDATTLRCGGGVSNTDIAKALLSQNLAGGEWLYYLPGHIGATTRMNARCFGGEISKIVAEIKTIDSSGRVNKFLGSDPQVFCGYKDTVFMKNGHLIFEVTLKFFSGDHKEIEKKMAHNKTQRDEKGHFNYPSCGCVFKNDYDIGVPSGLLLDLAGAKSLSVGKAQINPDHANFIYNLGDAASEDILKLSFLMRESVYKKFGVWLEYEMELLGSFHPRLLEKYQAKKPHIPKVKAINEAKTRFKA